MTGLSWKGLWDASINMPYLANADDGNCGHQYIVSEDGSQSINGYPQLFSRGDQVISNGVTWEIIPADNKIACINSLSSDATNMPLSAAQGKMIRRMLTSARPVVVYELPKSRVLVWEKLPIDSGTYHVYIGDVCTRTNLTTYVDVDVLRKNDYYVFDANNDPFVAHRNSVIKSTGIPLTANVYGMLTEDSKNIIDAPGSTGIFLITPDGQKTGPFLVEYGGHVNLQGRTLGTDDRLVLL